MKEVTSYTSNRRKYELSIKNGAGKAENLVEKVLFEPHLGTRKTHF